MTAFRTWIALLVCSAALTLADTPGTWAADEGADGSSSITLGGQELSCTDYRGRPVRTYTVAGLGDAGFSEIYFRVPVIKIDPDVMGTLPGKLQVFFFLHECAHHTLGHLASGSAAAETEADCWAIHTGRDNAFYGREDIVAFGRYFAASGGSLAGHLPGPKRHAFLLACFNEK